LSFQSLFRLSLVGLLCFASTACQDPLPIPQIDVADSGINDGYVAPEGIRVHAFRTGVVKFPEAVVWAGGSWTDIEALEVYAFVIEHPTAGLVVFDTGMSPRAAEDPGYYVGSLGEYFDMLEMEPGQDLVSQMTVAGLDPAAVTRVVISHFHFDHTGMIEAFPAAEVVVAVDEKHPPKGASGWLPDFVFPEDFDQVERWRELDYDKGEAFATFVSHFDLLGDGSLLAISLSGHTPGSQGLVVRTSSGPILLTGDAAWVDKSWRFTAAPIFAYDSRGWWEQAWRIRRFYELAVDAVVIPGHDRTAVERVKSAALVAHPFGRSQLEG
jgi:N-acyl homoserine lactone hydrolase